MVCKDYVLARPFFFRPPHLHGGGIGIINVMKNLVILISGGGSNMLALARTSERDDWAGRYQARITAVISNKADAKGLQLAQDLGISTSVVDHKAFSHAADPRAAFDAALMADIDQHQPALVLLAGFMRILTPGFVAH